MDGIQVNQTLVFTVNQALLGANAGSTVVSPFVGRLDDIGQDGMALVRDIVDVYRQQSVETHVMAASIRGASHCVTAAQAGAHISTIPYNVLTQMIKHPLTDAGLVEFPARLATSFRRLTIWSAPALALPPLLDAAGVLPLPTTLPASPSLNRCLIDDAVDGRGAFSQRRAGRAAGGHCRPDVHVPRTAVGDGARKSASVMTARWRNWAVTPCSRGSGKAPPAATS